MSSCDVCRELGEMCHDCKASRRRVAASDGPKVFDHEGKRADAAQKRLVRLRKSELPRVKARLKSESGLWGAGLVTNSVGREQHGEQKQRAVVGQKSGFHNPAYAIGKAIERALDPNQLPPRRFVPKKREPKKLERIFRADGKLNSQRYHGWDVNEVAEINPGFLGFLMTIECASEDDKRLLQEALNRAEEKKKAEERAREEWLKSD